MKGRDGRETDAVSPCPKTAQEPSVSCIQAAAAAVSSLLRVKKDLPYLPVRHLKRGRRASVGTGREVPRTTAPEGASGETSWLGKKPHCRGEAPVG